MANKTYIEVIQQLIKVNDDLISKKIDLDVAKQIAQNTQVVINAAKVHIEFLKLTGGKAKNDGFFKSPIMLEEHPDDKKVEKDKTDNHEKDYAKNSNKSCDKCADWQECLDSPKCPLDKYTHFKSKE